MGDDLVHVGVGESQSERAAVDVALYDPLDPQPVIRNAIVLLNGIACRSAEFDRTLTRISAGGAAAVLVKARGTRIEELRAASTEHDIAVIVVRDEADWTRLAAMARTALAGAAADSVSGVRLGDMFAFADAVATIASGATSIVDPTGRIVGYSTIPGQQIDDLRRETTLTLHERTLPALDADYQRVYASATGVFVESHNDEVGRLAVAVRAGGELLGSIWVIDPGEERRDQAREALDRLAPLAGLHLLHARAAADFTERRNADLIRTLIDDAGHAPFAAAQLGLGFEYRHGFAVAAFAVAHPQPGGVDALREQQRLRQLVTVTCDVHFGSAYNALIDSVVYAILPCQGESFRAAHRRVIREIGGHTPAVGAHPVVAAVGGRVDALTDLRRSRDEAVRTLDYLLHRHSNDRQATVTALHEDHRVTLDLLRVGDFIVDNGLADGDLVERIRAHGEQLQTDFLDTLRVYLDCNGNVAQTAQRLHVHGNTIRYRIARLTEDFGVELDDPRTRLWLWLRLACAADTSSRPSGPRR